MGKSIIYRNIHVYRGVMAVLSGGRHHRRILQVGAMLRRSDRRVLELCFGDTVLAEFCRDHGRSWTGIDRSDSFVSRASRKGFHAVRGNILEMERLPESDVCIMIGSMYHFSERLDTLFRLMLQSAGKVIVSEPVVNLAQRGGAVGYLAKRLTGAGDGPERYRFSMDSLLAEMERLRETVGIKYQLADFDGVHVILEIRR
jgi:hypothetical protein